MPVVAHEGNPRTNSLAVSGTLDGDVYLIFAGEPAAIPPTPLPAPPPINEPGMTVSCPDVFSWNDDRDDPFTGWTTGRETTTTIETYDPNLAMVVHPSPACYGVIYKSMPQAASFTNSTGTEWPIQQALYQAKFLSLNSGAPRAGLCVAVQDPTRSTANLTLFAVVVDWAAGTSGLYYWKDGDIADLALATSSSITSYTPSVGDVLRVFFRQTDSSIFGSALILDSSWSTAASFDQITLSSGISHPLRCGYIAVGGGQEGEVLFGGVTGASVSDFINLQYTTAASNRNNID